MVLDTSLPFGMRDTRITPYSDTALTTLGTGMDVPNARSLSFTEAEDYVELRGDDKLVAIHGQGAHAEWSMESGGISINAYKAMAGGTVTTSGVTPNQITTYDKKVTDARPYFKAEGQSISDSGGDFHVVLYKCKADGNLEGELSDGNFWLTAGSGKALPATLTGKIDYLYSFVLNETTTAST